MALAQTGTIAGAIVSRAGEPLAYGIVGIDELGRRQFTDDSGRFVLRELSPGRYWLRVRRLGYTPVSVTVDVRADVTDTLRVELTRLAASLRQIDVHAHPPCVKPGVPSRAKDSVLADVLDQVLLNADQYRLLVQQYPFVSTMAAVRSNRMRTGRVDILEQTTVRYGSLGEGYKPGEVLHRSGAVWYFRIPGLSEFAGRDFLRVHCWHFVGAVLTDSTTLVRVDFVAFDGLKAPDVNGTILLDAETFQIRRSVLNLSRRFDLKAEMVDMEVSTDFREILPSIPIIAHVLSVQTMEPSAPVAETLEEHRLRTFSFLGKAPGNAPKAPPLPTVP